MGKSQNCPLPLIGYEGKSSYPLPLLYFDSTNIQLERGRNPAENMEELKI
jgi:hypothetical protein